MSDCLVVLPSYNEAENIESMVSKLLELGYFVCVVDDNSPDRTWETAQALTSQFPQVRVMRRIQEHFRQAFFPLRGRSKSKDLRLFFCELLS